jgi:glutamate synthase domain-containing protein 3
VKELVYKHLERTESDQAKEILGSWNRYQSKFWRIRPINLPPVPKPTIPATPAVEAVAKS